MKAKNQKVRHMSNKEHILSEAKPERFFFRASAADFKKIPGSPIAYWVSEKVWAIFGESKMLGEIASPKIGMRTGDNERFMRFWYEVGESETRISSFRQNQRSNKWVPYNKGGTFRKWYGNFEYVVNWENNGLEIKENTLLHYPQLDWDNLGWKISNEHYYFNEGVTWTDLSSSSFGVRYLPKGFIFDASGPCLFGDNPLFYLSILVTKQCFEFLKMLNPTLHFKNYNISALPIIDTGIEISCVEASASKAIGITRSDWDSYETSWDFTSLPLLQPDYRQSTLKATYNNLRAYWQEMTLEMQRLEEENNRIFIGAYGLQDELTPEVPLNEITLTCNPHYRYSNNKNAEELEALLLADTMKEFISYAVGCMFGRYALDKPGLILANQGDTIKEYLRQISDPTFPADDDNVIPILDGDWFTDDISDRFRKFLRITFGEEHYEENLKFIEVALGKEIRKYFLKDFYNDHLRRYKKRPIYWLFSSPKGSFNALIYMHRYRPDTASVVLNGYLREFRTKLLSRKSQLEAVSISASASPGEKTKALKEIESLRKMIEELESYEREILYSLATEQLEIDLDDGVKVNYQKFGPALRKIPGLDAKEE
jgi:type II restriction/modification system DNA methylase subunit YeeA